MDFMQKKKPSSYIYTHIHQLFNTKPIYTHAFPFFIYHHLLLLQISHMDDIDCFCTRCKSYTPLVYDYTSCHIFCSECGLVLVSHSILEPFEPNKLDSAPGLASPRAATKGIEEMAERLGLAEPIKKHAKEMYKKADDEKICGRQRNPRAVMGACLYLTCQDEGYARTFKEIHGVTGGTKMREIHKCVEILKKQLEVGTKRGVVHARDIARRYCSNLGMGHRAIRAVQEAVHKTDNYDIRRNSTSILAAAIYMVTQLSDHKITLRGK